MTQTHHLYLLPGLFGFGRLLGFDYFTHLEEALRSRFRAAGVPLYCEVLPLPPTSSLRHRSRLVARAVSATCGEDGPIHFLGHSSGGLDARLLLSPGTSIAHDMPPLTWRQRVDASVSISTPHHGTPLASYFSTVSGTQLLYALSLFTVISLSIQQGSLGMAARLVASIGNMDSLFGGDVKLLRHATDLLVRSLKSAQGDEVLSYLEHILDDRGALIQIMPESMDLFNAATEDSPDVRYGSVVTFAPRPRALEVLAQLANPYAPFSAALFATMDRFTAQRPKCYEYAPIPVALRPRLESSFHQELSDEMTDGVVPTLSMLWGELVWAGKADHLDTLGHFRDNLRPRKHTDWMTSGAGMTRARFQQMVDAIATFLLRGHS